MENLQQTSRRNFLSGSVKSAVLVGAGASFAGSFLDPVSAVAQNNDTTLKAKSALLGALSLQTSQLAVSRATHQEVKRFAKFEAAEQEVMGKILKEMGTVVPLSGTDEKAAVAKLQSLNGAGFDKAFMQAQVMTHQKLHEAVSAWMGASKDAHVKHVSSLALATITEHTERAKFIIAGLG